MFFYRRRQPGAFFDCSSIGEGSREPLAIGERSDVRALEYDRFGAVVYEEAGNGTRSHRTYDATTRRVDTIEAGDFQNVHHTFDAVGQIAKAIVPTHRPILEHLPTMVRHIADIRAVVLAGFHAHVPVEDNPTRGYVDTLLDGVPLRDRIRFVRQVIASLLPGYDPMSLREPAFATEWFRLEREGRDMTRVFPASAA